MIAWIAPAFKLVLLLDAIWFNSTINILQISNSSLPIYNINNILEKQYRQDKVT